MLITIGEASSDGFAAIKVTALGRPQILVCLKQLLTTTWYCEGIRRGGVSGVKSGRGDWVFIRLWKVYPGFTLYKEV